MASKFIGDNCVGDRHAWEGPCVGGKLCHCGAQAICAQCWTGKPIALFRPAKTSANALTKNCSDCRSVYSGGNYGMRASIPRRSLRVLAVEPLFTWVPESGNKKLGPIPTVISSPETCPPSCGFYGQGCFAEFGPLGQHWRNVERTGVSFDALLEQIRALPRNTIWRYATAGDLPGVGDTLDIAALERLTAANEGRRGFTFTHKPLTSRAEQQAVRRANDSGFTVNLSADNPQHLVRRRALGCGPVALVVPMGTDLTGLNSFVPCPAEHRGLTCAECQLCTRSDRKSIVAFGAHGQSKRQVSMIAGGEPK